MTTRGRPRKFDRNVALQNALNVFWAKGFDCTSMPDLVTAMKINSPSIYAAFGSKEKLFQETVELYNEMEGGKIWASMDTEPTARLAIQAMLHASAEEFTSDNKPHGCFITLGALASEGGNESIRQDLQRRRKLCISLIQARLERGESEGELPTGQDWSQIAAFYTSLQQGMSIQARDGASREVLLAVADLAMTTLDGIIAKN